MANKETYYLKEFEKVEVICVWRLNLKERTLM